MNKENIMDIDKEILSTSCFDSDEPPSTGPLKSESDWKWQLGNSITTIEQLKTHLELEEGEELGIEKAKLPFRITPYYLELIKKSPVLRKTVIPHINEIRILKDEEFEDPLSEEHQCPAPHIIHRYPDRVLFISTDFCASNCRYCTRSRMVGKGMKRKWEQGIAYIRSHKEIRDVLISGGDPLTLSDVDIEWLLHQICLIGHVEIVRIGTKVPVVLPQRITSSLLEILDKYNNCKPIYMNIHFTHADELTPECITACKRLSRTGVILGSQTVLLIGVNDSPEVLGALFKGLLRARVKPYYLYRCDMVQGTSHFRTTIEKGAYLLSQLRGYISGLAIPHYIVDLPEGKGKVPVGYEYYRGEGKFLNYKGEYVSVGN
jgi:lysine 2,3-aminomutase